MKHFLLVFDCNWSDEFDTHGFAVFTEEQYNEWMTTLDEMESDDDEEDEVGEWSLSFPYEFYFGTNECIDFDTKEDLLYNVKVKEIPEQDANTLRALFGLSPANSTFGIFPELD